MNTTTIQKAAFLALLGATLALGAGELRAETRKPGTPAEFLDSMARQGWGQATPGVLQRQVGNDKVETFAYGREGLQWALTQAQDRLGFFLREYVRNPSDDGRAAVVAQRGEVKRLERALAAAAQTKAGALDSFLNASCDFSYGSTANAYALSGGTAGVGAQATAYFNNSSCSGGNNCGYSGEVYSYAYVTARTGTTTTTKFQRDPLDGVKTGASVTSSASLTQTGNADCYSEASSAVTVASLNLYLSSYSSNSTCPVPPFQVTSINGSTYLYLLDGACQTKTWTATLSGGTPAFTYKWYWNGTQVGTGASYSRSLCGSFGYSYLSYPLSVTVTDALGVVAAKSTTVSVESDNSTTTCGGTLRSADGKLQQFPCL